MTRFSCLFGDAFLHFLFVGTVGCPSVILSENPQVKLEVFICHVLGLLNFLENQDFHHSYFDSEFLGNIKNFMNIVIILDHLFEAPRSFVGPLWEAKSLKKHLFL